MHNALNAILAVVFMVISVVCSMMRFNYASVFFLALGVWMLIRDVHQDDGLDAPDDRLGD
jgi:uncharacterized membrane protein